MVRHVEQQPGRVGQLLLGVVHGYRGGRYPLRRQFARERRIAQTQLCMEERFGDHLAGAAVHDEQVDVAEAVRLTPRHRAVQRDRRQPVAKPDASRLQQGVDQRLDLIIAAGGAFFLLHAEPKRDRNSRILRNAS